MGKGGKKAWLYGLIVSCVILVAAWCLKDDITGMYYAARIQDAIKKESTDRVSKPENFRYVDSGVTILRNGDLVLRTGADVISYMLCQLNQENKTYSHCGLVMIENDYPFVYHSIGGEDNPDEKIRRDSAKNFFSPVHNRGFGIARFDADSIHVNNLRQVVQRLYKEGHKFDLDFDLGTNDRLYCAEFVYKAVDEAMNDTSYIRPITRKGFTFVGIDNLFCNSHTHVVCQIEYK